MPLGKRSRIDQGTFCRERGDALAKHWREDYPEFARVPDNTRLDIRRNLFTVSSLNAVKKIL